MTAIALVVETALAWSMEDVVIEFGESVPLLATSIDKEEMLMLVCTFEERGKVLRYLVLSLWSIAVTWPVCLSLLFSPSTDQHFGSCLG